MVCRGRRAEATRKGRLPGGLFLTLTKRTTLYISIGVSVWFTLLQLLLFPMFRGFMTTDYAASNCAQHAMMMSVMPRGAAHCRPFQATCCTGGIASH